MRILDEVSASNVLTQEQIRNMLQRQIELMPELKQGDSTGLRLDLNVEDPTTGEAMWVDVSVVHTTAASYVEKELSAVVKRRTSQEVADECKLPDVLQYEPSPPLQ